MSLDDHNVSKCLNQLHGDLVPHKLRPLW